MVFGFDQVVRFCETTTFPTLIDILLIVGALASFLWFSITFFRAIEQKRECELLIEDARIEAERWFSVYDHACKELNATEEALRKAEDELFDLQQAHNELGEAYNELRELLIENGIDPDFPRF